MRYFRAPYIRAAVLNFSSTHPDLHTHKHKHLQNIFNTHSHNKLGGLNVIEVPQMVLITFDDAISTLNIDLYEEMFNNQTRFNPNGCPLRATFYVSHEWTDYGMVQNLYSDGHEMASHSVS
uniref:NodB homology domain-containing protein n=1 Tax=Ceratitis capitata TaxID=7213 RepID=W8BJ25_CERCA